MRVALSITPMRAAVERPSDAARRALRRIVALPVPPDWARAWISAKMATRRHAAHAQHGKHRSPWHHTNNNAAAAGIAIFPISPAKL